MYNDIFLKKTISNTPTNINFTDGTFTYKGSVIRDKFYALSVTNLSDSGDLYITTHSNMIANSSYNEGIIKLIPKTSVELEGSFEISYLSLVSNTNVDTQIILRNSK